MENELNLVEQNNIEETTINILESSFSFLDKIKQEKSEVDLEKEAYNTLNDIKVVTGYLENAIKIETSDPNSDNAKRSTEDGVNADPKQSTHLDDDLIFSQTDASETLIAQNIVTQPKNEVKASYFNNVTNTYDCTLCNKKYKTKYSHKTHMKLHTGENIFECVQCSKKFPSHSQFCQHLKSHVNQGKKNRNFNKVTNTYDCNLCDQTFKKHFAFELHKLSHSAKYPCFICHKKFANNPSFQKHMSSHATEISKLKNAGVSSVNQDLSDQNETTEIKNEKTYPEEVDSEKIEPAIETIKSGEDKIKASISKFTCEVCNRKYMNKYSLKTHMKTHTGKDAFTCPTCHKIFTTISRFQKHLKQHSKVIRKYKELHFNKETNTYDCKQCDTKYKDSYSLRIHLSTHANLGTTHFQCPKCENKFASRYQLQRHMNIHRAERFKNEPLNFNEKTNTYDCKLCEKKFKHRYPLFFHMNLHTGRSIHHCPQCFRVFARSWHLKRHIKSHAKAEVKFKKKSQLSNSSEPVKKLTCKYCNKKCTNYHYYAHKRAMRTEKRFNCPECNEEFLQKTKFRKHILIHIQKRELKNVVDDAAQDSEVDKIKIINANIKTTTYPETITTVKNEMETLYFNETTNTYDCNECKRKCKSESSFKSHLRLHKKANLFQCSLCFESFRLKKMLKTHIMEHESKRLLQKNIVDDAEQDNAADKIKIINANVKTKAIDTLATTRPETITTVKNEIETVYFNETTNTFDCKECKQKCKSESYFKYHLRLHKKENLFQCPQCFESFSLKTILENHIKDHESKRRLEFDSTKVTRTYATVKKSYECFECNKKFIRFEHLRDHVQLHVTNKVMVDSDEEIASSVPYNSVGERICKEELILPNDII